MNVPLKDRLYSVVVDSLKETRIDTSFSLTKPFIPLCSYNELLVWQFGVVYVVPLPGSVPSARAVVHDSSILVFGLKEGQSFNNSSRLSSGSSKTITKSERNLIHTTIVLSGVTAYLFGGATDLKKPLVATTACSKFNCQTDQWETLPPMNSPRMNTGVIVQNAKAYVVGGRSTEAARLSSIEVLDLAQETWRVLPVLVTPMSHISCVPVEQEVLILASSKECFVLRTEPAEFQSLCTLDCRSGDSLVSPSTPLVLYKTAYLFTGYSTVKISQVKNNFQRIVLFRLKLNKVTLL